MLSDKEKNNLNLKDFKTAATLEYNLSYLTII